MKQRDSTTPLGHTPGPWKIDRSFPRQLPFGISQQNEPHKGVLTSMAFCKKTTDEAAANASLIAAAPDLLAALEWIASQERYTFAECTLAEEIIDRARAAIKKARGE